MIAKTWNFNADLLGSANYERSFWNFHFDSVDHNADRVHLFSVIGHGH